MIERIGRKIAAAGLVVAVGAAGAGAYFEYKKHSHVTTPTTSTAVDVPKENTTIADRISIRPVDNLQLSVAVYAVKSTARTHWAINGKDLGFGGHGVVMDPGKIVKSTYVAGSGVRTYTAMEGDKEVRRVDVDVNKVSYDTHVVSGAGNTVMTAVTPKETLAVETAVHAAGLTADTACRSDWVWIPLGISPDEGCKIFGALEQWGAHDEGVLESNLAQATEKQVQTTCAAGDAAAAKQAITDSFKQQAVDDYNNAVADGQIKTYNPLGAREWADTVVVRFVDAAGNLTTQTPQYKSRMLDPEIAAGTLSDGIGGAAPITFSQVTCTQESSYQPAKF